MTLHQDCPTGDKTGEGIIRATNTGKIHYHLCHQDQDTYNEEARRSDEWWLVFSIVDGGRMYQ